MDAATRLAAYALLLLAVAGAAFAIGRAVGPLDGAPEPAPHGLHEGAGR